MRGLKPESTIGILGGGQLGRMLAMAAARLGFRCHIYSPEADSCAFDVADAVTIAAYEDEAALARFAEAVDVVTYEFENVPAQTAAVLAAHRQVRPDRIRKSVGAENTYSTDLKTLAEACDALVPLADKVWRHVSRHKLQGRTVTVKVKFSDFKQITRARTLPHAVENETEMLALAQDLAASVLPDPRGARLLGITLSGFDHSPDENETQLRLF